MGFTEAVNKVVHEKLPEGTGGVVAVGLRMPHASSSRHHPAVGCNLGLVAIFWLPWPLAADLETS
jgi:hypothetical protein